MTYVTLVDGRTLVYENTERVVQKGPVYGDWTVWAKDLRSGDEIRFEGAWHEVAYARCVRTQAEIDRERALQEESERIGRAAAK